MIKSTRKEVKVSASQAILEGLANDGGLYMFDNFKQIDYKSLINYSYKELSCYLLNILLDDYTCDEIKSIINNAYDDKFDNENIVGFHNIDNVTILELFHGPTLAFKDMALTVLPNLLRIAKQKNNIKDDTIILTATSGDTGGATLSGFKNVDGMKVIVFYPNGGVSNLQEKQMLSFASENMRVIAYDGNFDDTQNFVKEMFMKYPKLSSSNSINIGRLVPQIIYYFYSYLEMVRTNNIKMDEMINICVPTGNFGNILAGYMAKKMGLPIKKMICASNQNNVLTDFFNTGIYNKKREFYKTNSPSMDILISSNLERLLYLINGSTEELMTDLNEKGMYKLSKDSFNKLKDFDGEYLTEEETLEIINKVYNDNKYLIDPHTAVCYGSYLKYLNKTNDKTKTIVVSTASPYKFAQTITKALNITCEDDIRAINEYTNIDIPKVIRNYKNNKKVVWMKNEVLNRFNETIKELGYEEN